MESSLCPLAVEISLLCLELGRLATARRGRYRYGARTSGRNPCGERHRASPIDRQRARAAFFITADLLNKLAVCNTLAKIEPHPRGLV